MSTVYITTNEDIQSNQSLSMLRPSKMKTPLQAVHKIVYSIQYRKLENVYFSKAATHQGCDNYHHDKIPFWALCILFCLVPSLFCRTTVFISSPPVRATVFHNPTSKTFLLHRIIFLSCDIILPCNLSIFVISTKPITLFISANITFITSTFHQL